MTNDLKDFLIGCNIIAYRLIDGSHILAEEVDFDMENNSISIINPLEILIHDGKDAFTPWINSEKDEIIRIDFSKIVGSIDASLEYKSYYFKYFLYNKVKNILTNSEIEQYLNTYSNTYPSFDNQDYSENEGNFKWDWRN